MANVFLKYNPFTVETTILINGRDIGDESKLANFKHERLQMWLDQLIPILVEECNDDLHITFKGTQLDYDDLLSTIQEYRTKIADIEITVEYLPSKASNDRFKDLTALFEYLQKECPFCFCPHR